MKKTDFVEKIKALWGKFEEKHTRLAPLLFQFLKFFVFSNGVTVWQYLVMLFLPYAFASLAGTPFVWPEVTFWTWADGTPAVFGIFNEPVLYDSAGEVMIGGGLGNFIAFEIAVFTAQCINFPLQRNYTFKSHGNPVMQAAWYFVGWILVSIFVNAIWGLLNIFFVHWNLIPALTALVKTFITGGVSMIIFFFLFKIIFADTNNKKTTSEVTEK